MDTETAEYEAWSRVYTEHGVQLPLELWASAIGLEQGAVDFLEELERLSSRSVDRKAMGEWKSRLARDLVSRSPALPGAKSLLEESVARQLKLGVASSSPHWWVDPQLERVSLHGFFGAIVCREDAPNAKPDPDLYLAACDELGVAPSEAVAFEDSPNGVKAAKRAGLFCIAVPNKVTRGLDLSGADLRLPSLAEVDLDELL